MAMLAVRDAQGAGGGGREPYIRVGRRRRRGVDRRGTLGTLVKTVSSFGGHRRDIYSHSSIVGHGERMSYFERVAAMKVCRVNGFQ